MADITTQIRAIQQASRGEEVRDAIVSALQVINTNIETDVDSAVTDAKTELSRSLTAEITRQINEALQDGSEVEF